MHENGGHVEVGAQRFWLWWPSAGPVMVSQNVFIGCLRNDDLATVTRWPHVLDLASKDALRIIRVDTLCPSLATDFREALEGNHVCKVEKELLDRGSIIRSHWTIVFRERSIVPVDCFVHLYPFRKLQCSKVTDLIHQKCSKMSVSISLVANRSGGNNAAYSNWSDLLPARKSEG